MTTKNSPLRQLQAQADQIATALKNAEQGVYPAVANVEKLRAARANPTVKVAIAMDDKLLNPEISWEAIRGLSHNELARWIVRQMREEPDRDRH